VIGLFGGFHGKCPRPLAFRRRSDRSAPRACSVERGGATFAHSVMAVRARPCFQRRIPHCRRRTFSFCTASASPCLADVTQPRRAAPATPPLEPPKVLAD
jgi:hypothetical protein